MLLADNSQISRNSDAGLTPVYQQVVARSCAGNVEQVAFGCIDLFELAFIRGGFDSLL